MYINLPQQFTKKDVRRVGIIEKDRGKDFVLSSINGVQTPLTTNGFYCYVYVLCDTYLVLIGNQKGLKDIKPNNINFLQKITEFEYNYQSKPRMFKTLDICDNMFYIMSQYLNQTFNEKWLNGDLTSLNSESIDFIINNVKTYLKGYKTPLNKYISFICDNEDGIGQSKYCVSIKTLYANKIIIYKDKNIGGYIIKYNHDKFI